MAATRYLFDGLTRPIALDAPPLVERLFGFFLAHWPVRTAPADGAADIVIGERAGGLDLAAPALAIAEHCADETVAVNRLGTVLVSMVTRQRPDLFAAHASAVALGGRAIVMPGDTMSGKSTLALQLTRLGGRHFGDDQVLLQIGAQAPRALALGLTPRMRLPVHALAGPDFAQFIAARLGRQVENFAVVELGREEFAPFGTDLPVALVALPRLQAGAVCQIRTLPRAAAVQSLLEQGRAPHWDKPRWLDALGRALARVEVVEIVFDKSDQAAEHLQRHVLS